MNLVLQNVICCLWCYKASLVAFGSEFYLLHLVGAKHYLLSLLMLSITCCLLY